MREGSASGLGNIAGTGSGENVSIFLIHFFSVVYHRQRSHFVFSFVLFPVHDGLYCGGPSTDKEAGMDNLFGFGLSVYPVRTVMV